MRRKMWYFKLISYNHFIRWPAISQLEWQKRCISICQFFLSLSREQRINLRFDLTNFTRIKYNQLFKQGESIYYACSWRLRFEKKKREEINWNQICCISHRETQWSSTMIPGRKHEICSAQPNYNISHVSNENCAKRWFHELLRHTTRLWNYSISFSCSNRYVVSSNIFNQQRDMWVFESQHRPLFAFFRSFNNSSLALFSSAALFCMCLL